MKKKKFIVLVSFVFCMSIIAGLSVACNGSNSQVRYNMRPLDDNKEVIWKNGMQVIINESHGVKIDVSCIKGGPSSILNFVVTNESNRRITISPENIYYTGYKNNNEVYTYTETASLDGPDYNNSSVGKNRKEKIVRPAQSKFYADEKPVSYDYAKKKLGYNKLSKNTILPGDSVQGVLVFKIHPEVNTMDLHVDVDENIHLIFKFKTTESVLKDGDAIDNKTGNIKPGLKK